MNKPCVELIVENQHKWDHDLWDDVALSKVMHELNIKPLDIKRFNIEGNIFRQEIDLKIINSDAGQTLILITQDILKLTYLKLSTSC